MPETLSRSPATQRLYQELKARLLASPAGMRLGSQSEMVAVCGASRPTFRHAIAILEEERLVEVRRGPGGGYFARRPTALAAAAATASYCHATGITREEVLAAWMPIRLEAIRLAARDRGALASEELVAFITEQRRGSSRGFARTVRRFNLLLTRMAGNRMLSLFSEILYEAGNAVDQQDFYRRRPSRIAAYRTQMLRMGDAIVAGDEEGAMAAGRACFMLNRAWLAQDHRLTGRTIGDHI